MSQEDDEFYCGSEESEKESINPFREIREAKNRPRNALQEAIDRALRTPVYTCGTKQNPHVIEIVDKQDKLKVGPNDLLNGKVDLSRFQFRCRKCGDPVICNQGRISRMIIELVTHQDE